MIQQATTAYTTCTATIPAFAGTSLGSNSVISTLAGSKVSETRYLPFGDYRTAPTGIGDTLTDRGYTGQKENMEIGLIYYNARFYVPGIGRFASADTIVPSPANPQSFNRYSYVENRPLNFTDPTGHCAETGDDTCWSAYDRLYSFIHNAPDIYLNEGSPWLEQATWDQLGTLSESNLNAAFNLLKNPGQPVEVQNSNSSNWPAWTYSRWFPDYLKVDATFVILGFSLIIDDYSNFYFTFGGNFGGDSPFVSGRVAGGWLLLGESPEDDKVNLLFGNENAPIEDDFQRYFPGFGAGGGLGAILGADVAISSPWSQDNGTGSAALEVGVYSPQAGVNGGYTWDITSAIIKQFYEDN